MEESTSTVIVTLVNGGIEICSQHDQSGSAAIGLKKMGLGDPYKTQYSMETNLSFSQALDALKKGKAISREGWNGKGMFVFLNKGSHDFPQDQENPGKIESIRTSLFEKGDKGAVTRLPNLNMQAATGSTVTGWLASQTDLLAEDWCVLD